MITQHFILHMVPDEVRPRIYLSQRSTGLEKLQFTLVGTNGAYYTIPSGTSVTFVGTKPDRKSFSYACTYSGHTASVDVTEQLTAVAGTVRAELRFENSSGATLPSQNMEIIVERSPLDGSVCSKNDFISVDEEIISIHQEAVLAKHYAEEAEGFADTAEQTVTAGIRTINSKVSTATTTITNTVNTGKADIDAAVAEAVEHITQYGQTTVQFYYTQSTGSFRLYTIDPE